MSSDAAIVSGVRALWEEGLLHDFTIHVDHQRFTVNKCIMASVSHYFKAMFTSNMTEAQKGEVHLKAIGATVMEHIIHFIYKDDLGLTVENATEILEGAVFLQMPSAIDVCIDFIVSNISMNDLYRVLALFEQHSLVAGIQQLRDFQKENMSNIIKECAVCSIPLAEMIYLIDNWEHSERDLYIFLRKWIDSDLPNRQEQAGSLMTRIRYCLMPIKDLERVKGIEDDSRYKGSWQNLICGAMDYHKLPTHQKVLHHSKQSTLRANPTFVLFPARRKEGCKVLGVDNTWETRSDFKLPNNCNFLVDVNNFLITGSGEDHVRIFDPRTLSWYKLAPITQNPQLCVVHNATQLFIVGGKIPDTIIQAYDFQTDTWSKFTDMPSERSSHHACILGDCIYVTGGTTSSSDETVAIVHCLNINTKTWKRKAPMLEPLSDHCMTVIQLFGEPMIGVLTNHFRLMYYNVALDQWSWFSHAQTGDKGIPKDTLHSVSMVRNNTVFFADDINAEKEWQHDGTCMIIEYPEQGTSVHVVPIQHFTQKPYQGEDWIVEAMTFLTLSKPSEKDLKVKRKGKCN